MMIINRYFLTAALLALSLQCTAGQEESTSLHTVTDTCEEAETMTKSLADWFGAEHECTCSDHANTIQDTVKTLCQSTEEFCCPEIGRCHSARQNFVEIRSVKTKEVEDFLEEVDSTIEAPHSNKYCVTHIGPDIPNEKVEVCWDWIFDNSQPGNVWACEMEVNGVLCNSCLQCPTDDVLNTWDCTNIPDIENMPADIVTPTANCVAENLGNCNVDWTTQPLGTGVTADLLAAAAGSGIAMGFWKTIASLFASAVAISLSVSV